MYSDQSRTTTFLLPLRAAGMAFALSILAACGGGGSSSPLDVQTAPTITSQPASVTVTAPATASFSVTATGTPAPSYQWSANGVAIPGATASTFTTAATVVAMSGATYTVTATNPAGSVTSAPAATLTVSAVASAANPAIGWNGVNSTAAGFNYTQGSYLIGFKFTANRAITITQLGAYDSSLGNMPNGAQTFQSTPVGLYNLTTHTLLASATVKASDPATKVYRYSALATPVALNNTDTYAVVWVTGTNHYVATENSSIIVAADVNAAVNYLAFAGLGPNDGLTQTNTIAEPNFFVAPGLNYDIGSNFMLQ